MAEPLNLFVKYFQVIVVFDNQPEFDDFLATVADSQKVYSPGGPSDPRLYIAGIRLPKDREDTPEDAYEASRKVREWVERFRQAQDQDISSHMKQTS